MEKSNYEMVMGLAKSDFTFEMLIQAAMIKAKAGQNLAKLQIEFFDLWFQLVHSAKLAGVKTERRKSGKVVWLDSRRTKNGQPNAHK